MRSLIVISSIGLSLTAAHARPPDIPTPSTEWRQRAASYLDKRVTRWLDHQPRGGNNVRCALTCHTGQPYLMVRARLGGRESAVARRLRKAVEERVRVASKWKDVTPMYGRRGTLRARQSLGSEAVLNATSLAILDVQRGGSIRAVTRKALDHLWSMQRKDGAWDWLDFRLEPWESGNAVYGAALAAAAIGALPTTAVPAERVARLRAFLREQYPSARLHGKAVMLWASGSLDGVLNATMRRDATSALERAQRPDGGWALPILLGRSRPRGSDGYATGLATVALCRGGGRDSRDPVVARGLKWLATNQRADGSWRGRTVNRPRPRAGRMMADAATNWAALALDGCAPK